MSATHDYSANCFRGCGRAAVVIEADARYCARCWLARQRVAA